MKVKASGSITIKNLSEPFSVILTNEAQQFSTDPNRKVTSTQSYYTDIIVYQGTTLRTDYTIGTINSANNITVSKNASRVTFSVTAGTTVSADTGSFTIPIIIDGKTVNKVFSWSCGKQGVTGSTGTAAKSVDITASSQVFKSTDGGQTFSPNTIVLTPIFQGGISFLKWQYSTNGGSNWTDVVSGNNGLYISSGVLTINKTSALYTDSITSITFKCISNNSAYYDTMTVLKLYDVTDIQVGGRNLLPYTKTLSSPWVTSYGKISSKKDGFNVYETDLTMEAGKYYDLQALRFITPLPNTKYTLSFWAKGNGKMQSYFYPSLVVKMRNSDGNWKDWTNPSDGITSFILTGTWKKYWVTWTTAESVNGLKSIILCRQETNVSGHATHVSIYAPKLEIGTTATDWTPAPEDIENEITSVQDTISQVEMVVDKDNKTIRDSVWEKIYLWNPARDSNGNIIYVDKTDSSGNKVLDANGNPIKVVKKDTTKDALNIIERTNETRRSIDELVSEVYYKDGTNRISRITQAIQTANKFSWLVKSESSQSSLTLTDAMLSAIVKQFKVTGSDGSSTVIEGGKIKANSITSDLLSTSAIKSKNYVGGSYTNGAGYSAAGTFLDLSNGLIHMPGLYTDIQGNTYMRGTINATAGLIGIDSTNSWKIGSTSVVTSGSTSKEYASLTATGRALISTGKLQLHDDKLNTYNYGSYIKYNGTYYDYGIQAPELDKTKYDSGNTEKTAGAFIYVRSYTPTTGSTAAPQYDSDWTYLFRVTKDGSIYFGETLVSGADGAFLSKSGGTITGNLTVTGTITGNVTGSVTGQAGSVKNSLSINGRSYNGSAAMSVDVRNIIQGGTGASAASTWTQYGIVYASSTTALKTLAVGTSGQVLKSNGSAAPSWVSPSTLSVASAVKATQDASGNVITSTYLRKDFTSLSQNINFDGSITIEDLTTGSLLVSGSAKFSNTISGNISGNAGSATKLQTARKIGNASFNGTTDITLAQLGAATSEHTHDSIVDSGNSSYNLTFSYAKAGLAYANYTWLAAWNGKELRAVNKSHFATSEHGHSGYASKITLAGTDYSVSSNVITITKANLQTALGTTGLGLITDAERTKLNSIKVSSGGTIDFSGVSASGALTATISDTKTVTITHNTSGITAGTYRSVTVDTYGHVTVGTNPTTLSGYGITDALKSSTKYALSDSVGGNALKANLLANLYSDRPVDANIVTTGSGGVATLKATSAMTSNKPYANGHILHFFWDTTGGYDSQLFVANGNSPHMQIRGMTSGTYGSWITVLDSNNYNNYSPKKDGTGASGTWGINISGNAATATKANTATSATSATTASSATKATQDASGNVITTKYVAVDTTQTISGAKTFSNIVNISNTTASTSKTTGALKVSGGIGISGKACAKEFGIDDHVSLQYDSSKQCLNFVFS